MAKNLLENQHFVYKPPSRSDRPIWVTRALRIRTVRIKHMKLPREADFWACHYDIAMGSPTSETVLELARLPMDSMYAWLDRNPPPSFRIPLAPGYDCLLSYFEDRVEYALSIEAAETVVIGFHSGNWALPALRWEELSRIHQIRSEATGQDEADLTFLLLLPGVWLNESQSAIAKSIATRAWCRIAGLSEDSASRLAVLSTEPTKVEWSFDSALGWITTATHSARNPKCRMFEEDPDFFADVYKFFTAIGTD